MNLKKPINDNYAGTVVTIKNRITLAGCDNVLHTTIFGNMVIVGMDTMIGQKGVFFPVECQLSEEFLKENNLYKSNLLNKNTLEKGYFEQSGRIKCVKFRGYKSEGIFFPLNCFTDWAETVDLVALPEGTSFDHLNGVEICRKYIPKITKTQGAPGSRKDQRAASRKISRIIEGQFRLHKDTGMLGKSIHLIQPHSILSITSKLHGTSFVVGKVLCKKKLGIGAKLLKWFGANLVDTEYDMIYSSRKVIKNEFEEKKQNHYYDEDVWALAAKELEPFLINGMTIYGEIVGYTPNGKEIQKRYDYGCESNQMKIYIYRMTLTNLNGDVCELSAYQIKEWCKDNGLNFVPEYYYGPASDLVLLASAKKTTGHLSLDQWQGTLLDVLLTSFNMEEDCEFCKNKVPAEGIVVRVESLGYDAFKLKSFKFRERESKMLDQGEVDIETKETEQN